MTLRATVALAAGALLVACAALAATPPKPGTALAQRLRASGRAEARFVRETADPISGDTLSDSGKLALERPGRVAVDYTRTGERITLRPDGGEWLSPKLKQLLIIEGERLPAMSQWWQLIMEGSAPGMTVTVQSSRVLTVAFDAGAGPQTARLTLAADGLPQTLDTEGDRYRFSGWTFRGARGAAAFTQQAPKGYDAVRLP